jgi:hypothetical protein
VDLAHAATSFPDCNRHDRQFEPGRHGAAFRSRREAPGCTPCRIGKSWHCSAGIEGVQRLDYVRTPTAVLLIRWHLFLGDCHSFLSSSENWAERAAALGWNALALFGCYRTRPLEHLGSAGLLWAINGGKLVELHRDWAVIERGQDKSRQVHHRRRQDGAHVTLPWIGLPTESELHR